MSTCPSIFKRPARLLKCMSGACDSLSDQAHRECQKLAAPKCRSRPCESSRAPPRIPAALNTGASSESGVRIVTCPRQDLSRLNVHFCHAVSPLASDALSNRSTATTSSEACSSKTLCNRAGCPHTNSWLATSAIVRTINSLGRSLSGCLVQKPVDEEQHVLGLGDVVVVRLLPALQEDGQRVRVALHMQHLRENNGRGFCASDEGQALVGHHQRSGIKPHKRLLLNRVAAERPDPVPDAGVANRKADPLAATHPLPPGLLARQACGNRERGLLAPLENEGALDRLRPIGVQACCQVGGVKAHLALRIATALHLLRSQAGSSAHSGRLRLQLQRLGAGRDGLRPNRVGFRQRYLRRLLPDLKQ